MIYFIDIFIELKLIINEKLNNLNNKIFKREKLLDLMQFFYLFVNIILIIQTYIIQHYILLLLTIYILYLHCYKKIKLSERKRICFTNIF